VRNLTFQGISLDRGVSLTGPASHINFDGNIIDGGYAGGPGPSGFFFYGNGSDQTAVNVESNQIDHLDGDVNNSDGQCMTVAGGDRIEHDFAFSHNVCGPYIQDHYTQYGGIDGLVSDYNTFLGPLPANHTSACGGQTGCHNNTIQIFGSSDDVDFSNNYIWRTRSEAQAILWQEGTFKRMTINNNLIVDDPACFNGASCGEAPSLCQADGLTITNNTFVDQAWASLTVSSERDSQGVCPGDYSKGATEPATSGGSDNDISHNIAITPDGAKINGYSDYNIVTACGSGPCAWDENVSEDVSAAPSSPYTGARSTTEWRPAFVDGSQESHAAFRAWYQGPRGLAFSAGYQH
ncbi:MAG: hypothetical protein JO130_10295, partial [Solirubrobacterales bacterium]|nr:hypothetical protein [Solirubrobacterales bacterium]